MSIKLWVKLLHIFSKLMLCCKMYFCKGMLLTAGLSFSVPAGQPVPSSLKNMYKELATDCGCSVPKHGSLVKVTCSTAHCT